MSVWSKIAKIASIVGPIAAIPFTGGASALGLGAGAAGGAAKATGLLGTIGKVAGAASPILGKMSASQSAAKQRGVTNNAALDRNKLDAFKTAEAVPDARMTTAMRAGRVANASPVHMNWAGPGGALAGRRSSVTGGYSDPIAPDVKSYADDIMHQTISKGIGGTPQPTPIPGETGMEKTLGGASSIMDILGILPTLMGNKNQQPVPMVGDVYPPSDANA